MQAELESQAKHLVQASTALLKSLKSFLSSFLHRRLAGDDLLDLCEDGGPIIEDCEGDVFFDAVTDKI